MEATAATANPAFAVNEDGSATEPKAFQQALREDAPRMAALQNLPEVAAILLGDDMKAMQDLLRQTWQASAGPRQGAPQQLRVRQFGCGDDAAPKATTPITDVHPYLVSLSHQAEKARKERVKQRMAHRTIDAQRATATVPR